MGQFIDTRDAAEKEAKAEVRWVRKYGSNFTKFAADRRALSAGSLLVARDWRKQGNMRNAVMVAKLARGHLIVARALDKAAARAAKAK